MAPPWQPGLYQVKSYASLLDAQSDATLYERMFCLIDNVAHRKNAAGDILPVGTFFGVLASYPVVGDPDCLYVDPTSRELYIWNGVAYETLFQVDQAAYWANESSSSYEFTYGINSPSGSNSLEERVINQDNLITDLVDGSQGFDLVTGEWTVPNDGDYKISGNFVVDKILGVGPDSGTDYVELKIQLRKYNTTTLSWDLAPIPILAVIRLDQDDIYSFSTTHTKTMQFNKTLIGLESGEKYRFSFAPAKTGAVGILDVRIRFQNNFILQAYQMQGISSRPLTEYARIEKSTTNIVAGATETVLVIPNQAGNANGFVVEVVVYSNTPSDGALVSMICFNPGGGDFIETIKANANFTLALNGNSLEVTNNAATVDVYCNATFKGKETS